MKLMEKSTKESLGIRTFVFFSLLAGFIPLPILAWMRHSVWFYNEGVVLPTSAALTSWPLCVAVGYFFTRKERRDYTHSAGKIVSVLMWVGVAQLSIKFGALLYRYNGWNSDIIRMMAIDGYTVAAYVLIEMICLSFLGTRLEWRYLAKLAKTAPAGTQYLLIRQAVERVREEADVDPSKPKVEVKGLRIVNALDRADYLGRPELAEDPFIRQALDGKDILPSRLNVLRADAVAQDGVPVFMVNAVEPLYPEEQPAPVAIATAPDPAPAAVSPPSADPAAATTAP